MQRRRTGVPGQLRVVVGRHQHHCQVLEQPHDLFGVGRGVVRPHLVVENVPVNRNVDIFTKIPNFAEVRFI